MKRCRKSLKEPLGLLRYRSTNPTASWDQFRDEDSASYDEIRANTRTDQGCVCAYCEIRLERDNEQVAHFHPKSDKSTPCNWALDWSNLWLACKGGSQKWMMDEKYFLPPLPANLSCDEFKGEKILDGQVLSPCEIPVSPRIFKFSQFTDEIRICVDDDACREAGVDPKRAQKTIDEFNLNCYRLAAARLAVYRPIERAIATSRESGKDGRAALVSLARKHLARSVEGQWPEFFTLIRWRFGTIAEDYLQSIGYEG